jgi:hypothetical protein
MSRLVRPLLAAAALAASASAPAKPPDATPAPRAVATPPASAAEGGFETGRLTGAEQKVAGPFVLTWLSPGAELEVVSGAPGGDVLGRVTGPLAGPFHVAAGASLRLAAAGEAVYSGYRPLPMTRALDAWVGRAVLVGVGDGPPERWTLRAIGGDHLTVERSRTYRVLPVRRIAEITWTELTGIDPTPRVVLSRE